MSQNSIIKKTSGYVAAFEESLASSYTVNDTQKKIWDILTKAAFESEDRIFTREPSLFHDGTPLGTSLCLTEEPFRIRALAEIGVCNSLLSEQIDDSLRTLIDIYETLNWRKSASSINWFCSNIFPEDPKKLENWWGGMWLGVVMGENSKTELRLYFNLRNGNLQKRWEKIMKTLEPFGNFADEVFRKASIASTAVPAGLGIVFSDDELKGIRLYQGLEKTGSDQIADFLQKTAQALDWEKEINEPLRKLENLFGLSAPQSITVSHDIKVTNSRLENRISRVKADINCTRYTNVNADLFEDWILSALDSKGQKAIQNFAQLHAQQFGGASLDYFSLGAQKNGSHRTVYVKPSGLAYSCE